MNIVSKILENLVQGLTVVDAAQGFSAIHRAGNTAVLWDRMELSGFQSWLDNIAPVQLPASRVILRPEAVRDASYASRGACFRATKEPDHSFLL